MKENVQLLLTIYCRFWKKVWKLKLPNKIPMFAWRIYKDGLPTKFHLWQRLVVEDEKCPFGKSIVEDIHHALFDCVDIRYVWAQQFPRLFLSPRAGSMADFVQRIQEQCSSEELEKFL